MSTQQMGGFTARLFPSTPLSILTSSYSSGVLIGELLSFTVGPANPDQRGATGTVHSVNVFDASASSAALTLLLFDRLPSNTTFTDGAAIDIADADGPGIFATVPVTQYTNFSDNAFGAAVGLGRPFQCQPGANTIWAAVMAGQSVTFATQTDLRLSIGVFLDQREPL